MVTRKLSCPLASPTFRHGPWSLWVCHELVHRSLFRLRETLVLHGELAQDHTTQRHLHGEHLLVTDRLDMWASKLLHKHDPGWCLRAILGMCGRNKQIQSVTHMLFRLVHPKFTAKLILKHVFFNRDDGPQVLPYPLWRRTSWSPNSLKAASRNWGNLLFWAGTALQSHLLQASNLPTRSRCPLWFPAAWHTRGTTVLNKSSQQIIVMQINSQIVKSFFFRLPHLPTILVQKFLGHDRLPSVIVVGWDFLHLPGSQCTKPSHGNNRDSIIETQKNVVKTALQRVRCEMYKWDITSSQAMALDARCTKSCCCSKNSPQ